MAIEKSPYLGRGSTDFDEIWQDDALWTSWPSRPLKILQIQDGGGRHLENWKIAISQPRFERFRRNLARWCSSTSRTYQPLKIWNFKNLRWRRPPSWKIEKSPYLGRGLTNFDEMWHSDAVRPLWLFGPLQRSKEIQDASGRHPNNLKITISRQRFEQPSDFTVFT